MDAVDRVVLGGSSHTVSPGGYTLGGGHSPISRSLGLGVDNVLEFTMVDVDGNLVVSTADKTEITYENGTMYSSSDVDLFWALRGGGGGTFGVVTEFVLKMHQPPSQVVKFYCSYAMRYKGQYIGHDLLKAFHSIMGNMPSEWGGYLLIIGSPISAELFGPILFVLNHYGVMSDDAKAYLEPFYSVCDNVNFTTYDSFYEYEVTITEEEYIWAYIFNTFMSVDQFTDDWLEFVSEEMDKAPRDGTLFGCTGALIGGKFIIVLHCTPLYCYVLIYCVVTYLSDFVLEEPLAQ